MAKASHNGSNGHHRPLALVELPAELLIKILEYMNFKENSTVRLVCRRLNELCAARLNSTFQRLQNNMLVRFQTIKSQMPRRESARRTHHLARECDIVEILHMRLTLLQMTFGKHIERKHICFFPGEILDEVFRILKYIASTQALGKAYKVTDELYELSDMAMEYFTEHIKPTFPDLTYWSGNDYLDYTTPFATPSKRLQLPLNSNVGFDSPISSRASAVGSSCSEPPLPYNNFEPEYEEDETESAPRSNMVLRKRIRRIRAGMKKYNTQLDEVKRELKTCKSKIDSQSKQVSEYANRLDAYDLKFEENNRKFGTLLTELNKCKTELQYYRSRSYLLQCLNCGSSLPDHPGDNNSSSSNNPPLELLPPQSGFDALSGGGIDKQAMVEDWLNPEDAPGPAAAPPPHAPQVQHTKDNPADTADCQCVSNGAAQLKQMKTDDEPYLRTGPGSPGYTRGGPRSPGGGGGSGPSSPGPSRAGKRKSRDGGGGASTSGPTGSKVTRGCKRPKVTHAN